MIQPSESHERTTGEAKRAAAELVPGHLITVTGDHVRHGGLSPRQVPKAWVQGLKDAGVDAKVAKVNRHGQWQTLPLVVQFDCPFDHLNEMSEGWAKVRLKVNPFTGWISIHEDSCRHCSQWQIEAWLIACPRCAAGEDRGEHPDHDEGEAMFYLPGGDESPIAYVIEAMAQFESGEGLVADDEAKAPAEWNAASARQWLDSLTGKDGSYIVPGAVSQREAWRLVKGISGHPPQRFVHKAQALRGAET
ncbi:hypothetical protein [Nocardioides ochotonae]|uniref:hypothetical protein n=1 Tax=Nocardioides ochotonae TaxID=2685869 RepID=UPI00140B786E|nr:hypothetical protein [Nocardioides ochotonae]